VGGSEHQRDRRHSTTPAGGFEADWPLVARIDGWLSREQAATLYRAAATVRPGCWIVEIGSAYGRSTAALGLGKEDGVYVLAIDPWPGPPLGSGDEALAAFCENMRRLGLAGDVQAFRGPSLQAARTHRLVFDVATTEASAGRLGRSSSERVHAWDEPAIGLLFVDGLHDPHSVLADIDAWEPYVVEGGLVLLHDAFFRVGVTIAVLRRHLLNWHFRYLGSVGNLAMFQRHQRVGNREVVRDSLRLLGRLSYFGRNVLTTFGVRRNSAPLLKLFPPEEDFEY